MEFLDPIQHVFDQLPLFLMVLFRIGGLIVFAPLLGSMVIPMPIKVLVVLIFSMAVFPLVGPRMMSGGVDMPNNMLGLAFGVGAEMLIGITMGFSLMMMFVGIQIGAELISQQMALSLARIIDPITNISNDVVSQFYMIMATLIYVLMDGHLVLIYSLVETFETIELMGANIDTSIVNILVSILTGSFMLGIRIAGPALAAIFLSTLAMGFISRTMPQLNILAAGFPIRITLSFLLLIASFGTVCLLFEESLLRVLSGLGTLFI